MHRLLAACLVMTALAAVIAVSAGDYGRPSGASPAFLSAGAVCAALVAYLLAASARAVADPKLCWMAGGAGIACAGLVVSLLGSPTIFPTGGPVDQSADAGVARYLVWHAGLAAAALLAVAGARPTRERIAALMGVAALLLAWTRLPRHAARRPRHARQPVHDRAEAARRAWSWSPRPARRSPGGARRTASRRGARCA